MNLEKPEGQPYPILTQEQRDDLLEFFRPLESVGDLIELVERYFACEYGPARASLDTGQPYVCLGLAADCHGLPAEDWTKGLLRAFQNSFWEMRENGGKRVFWRNESKIEERHEGGRVSLYCRYVALDANGNSVAIPYSD